VLRTAWVDAHERQADRLVGDGVVQLIERNPAVGRRRRLKVPTPTRTYLDRAEQIAALLEAAGELDAESRRTRYPLGRVLLATLTFTGLRIGEGLELHWRDVDLAAGRLRVGRSKTDAGTGRYVQLLPVLRDELDAYKTRCHSPMQTRLCSRQRTASG